MRVHAGSYCNSRNKPALEAVDVVIDFVDVSESKTNAAYESFVDNGVDDFERRAERKCDRRVVLPEPDSPLEKRG